MRIRTSLSTCALALLLGSVVAQADTLLIDRVRAERGQSMPRRGMSMAQVEHRFGAPSSKLAPAGGDSHWHPTINRWVYPSYIVYFERDRVIDAVMSHATPNEIGPKNASRTQ